MRIAGPFERSSARSWDYRQEIIVFGSAFPGRRRTDQHERSTNPGHKKLKKIFDRTCLIKSNLPKSLHPIMSQHQKSMLPFESKEPRRPRWRTRALNHAIPRGSVWHNVE